MKRKKFRELMKSNLFKQKFLVTLILVCLISSISVGYALYNTELSMEGEVFVEASGYLSVVGARTMGMSNVSSSNVSHETIRNDEKVTLDSTIKIVASSSAATNKDVSVSIDVMDKNGKLNYKVKVNTADVKANVTLYVYKYDSKTKTYNMVKPKNQKVKADANANIDCKFDKLSSTQNYEITTKKQSEKISKKILATVKVNTANKTIKENKSAKFKFDKGLNMDNVKSVKYSTTNKKVATVSKSGKIKAKDTGKVTVKAKVTLLNGKTKTVKMTIKVK